MKAITFILAVFLTGCQVPAETECVNGVLYLGFANGGASVAYNQDGTLVKCNSFKSL